MEHPESQHTDSLGELQQDSAVCILLLNDGLLLISQNRLASLSPLFHKLVTVDLKKSGQRKLHMQHVTKDTWNCITSFYFSNHKLVSLHNVQDVLVTCHMYELEELVQYCSEFLLSHCCAENCFNLLKLSSYFYLESLGREARRVLADNFPTLCKSADFLNLEKAHLLELLEKEEVVTTEDDLCQALLAWMEKNNADADTCTEVFQQLRLNRISDECLQSLGMYPNACMRPSPIQSLLTQETMRREQSLSKRQTAVEATRRRPGSSKNSLLLMGFNWHGRFLMSVWSFDERRWTQLPGPQFRMRRTYSCSALEDKVIVTGGKSLKSTHLFDLGTYAWSDGPSLLQERHDSGMTTIGHTAYVVGGYCDVGTLSSIEEYSEATGQWTYTGELLEATGQCGVAALGDTILVVGGNRSKAAGLIQTFNVHTRSAAVLDVSLPGVRYHVRAANFGTSAFFVGETGDLVQVREEKEKVEVTSLAALENFSPRRIWFGLHASNRGVRVFGGSISQSVSCWDSEGKQVTNDGVVEDIPEAMAECLALEVNIPAQLTYSLNSMSTV